MLAKKHWSIGINPCLSLVKSIGRNQTFSYLSESDSYSKWGTEPLTYMISHGVVAHEHSGERVFQASELVLEPIVYWAGIQPDKAALVGRGFEISYSELDLQTNALARVLQKHGVERGDRVAFVLPRGPQTLLLIVAILKTGAAYVPLDAGSPQSRIKDCLEDSQPKLAVYDRERGSKGDVPEAALKELFELAKTESTESLGVAVEPTDLAYMIFTSGTTGRPKGVPITHEQLSNFIAGNQEVCIQVRNEDRVFQGFSPASDGHHEEVWPTFAAGATLVVATNSEIYSGSDLGSFLNEFRVTIISCAPTLLSMVDDDVPTLRKILFGAENLPTAMVQRWYKPTCEILNTYGPTEATVGATFGVCIPDRPINIGKPLPNYYCYVVDEFRAEVPDGEEGELAISGISVASGYFGRDDLTVEKFVPNPYGDPTLKNPTVYLTGDRVKKDIDGNIVWLGRKDAQVKIRGHRIEISEIEDNILSYPAVQSGVVITRETEAKETQLVALLVIRQDEEFEVGEFLESLRDLLPGYMIPQVFERIDSVPRLPSGKVDRRACQLLRGQAFRIEREIVPPRTESEKMVVEMWSGLFPGQQVSSTDDFFRDLGGYSLLASKFISNLRSEKGFTRVSVLDIYENPSVRSFASILEGQKSNAHETPPFEPVKPGRYVKAKIWQGIGVMLIFGLQAFIWLGPIMAAIYFSTEKGKSDPLALWYGILFHAISVPVVLALILALKWIIGGKIKEGRYPIWGTTFLRWWFVNRLLAIAPLTFLTGTPLASMYLRLLGARVGKNVMLESLEFDCADLIEIGDDCVFENSSWIRPAVVAHGMLHIRRIKIASGCNVGVRSGIAGGAVMEEGASLQDLTCIAEGVVVPAGEEWAGTVAKKVEKRVSPVYDPNQQPSRTKKAIYTAIQTALVVVLTFLDSLPFMMVAFVLYNDSPSIFHYLYLEPLWAIGLMIFSAAQVLLIKWAVLGKLKPGTYDFPGFLWIRKWFSDKHLELLSGQIVPLYDSLFTRPWCIALGMKCGPRCEIALPRRMPYDLVEMGAESFLASEVSIGRPIRGNSKLFLERTTIGTRSFIGNDSVVPQGVDVPDQFLLGVLSTCPPNEHIGDEKDQAWLGSPPFKMPNRQVMAQFDTKQTYSPTAKLYFHRLVHETARLILPALCSLIIASLIIEGLAMIWNEFGIGWAIASVPFVYLIGAFVGAIICRISKALLIGTYRPTIAPLWSPFVWKTETHSAILHDFGAPLFAASLMGTPFMSGFMRLMGAKVGKRTYIHSTDWTETDLITIGDDVAINSNAPLQAHLFEDRVMKVGPIKVGDRCSVGNYSVILCESEMKNDSHVGHLSLVMKGETIPSNTFWSGSPAQVREEVDPEGGLA